MISNATRKRRLTKLADHLENIVKTKFDMGTWGEHKKTHHPIKDDFCGTAACALGWAGMDHAFRRAGLKLIWEPNDSLYGSYVLLKTDTQSLYGHDAGALFFGLTSSEAWRLFIPMVWERPPTRFRVIKEIQRLAIDREELKHESPQ